MREVHELSHDMINCIGAFGYNPYQYNWVYCDKNILYTTTPPVQTEIQGCTIAFFKISGAAIDEKLPAKYNYFTAKVIAVNGAPTPYGAYCHDRQELDKSIADLKRFQS